jgi:predicted nucleotidyltransferase
MTSVQGQLLRMLETVAMAIGDDLRERLVFVGGCTTALFITDPITIEDVRATDDVDLIVDLAGYGEWTQLQEQLWQKGFSESPDDNVICRMRLGDLKVDFMPDDEAILGFSNRWYAKGIETAVLHELPSGLEIKCLTPPLFVATKLEAYLGRGGDDPLGSHDLEDILLVVDGREELVAEIHAADQDIRSFVAENLRDFRQHYDFDSFLDGNIRGPEGRVNIVRGRLDAMAESDRGA